MDSRVKDDVLKSGYKLYSSTRKTMTAYSAIDGPNKKQVHLYFRQWYQLPE
jgi:hypothetical protein